MDFVLMRNWFDTDLCPLLHFDFKGSLMGRTSIDSETFKERDFFDLVESQRVDLVAIHNHKELFFEQLEQDTMFLAYHKFMDYSLLVGIHEYQELEYQAVEMDIDVSVFRQFHRGLLTQDKVLLLDQVYFFGLVDILQKYTLRKRLERGLKRSTSFSNQDPSVEEPIKYAHRLLEFMNKIVL